MVDLELGGPVSSPRRPVTHLGPYRGLRPRAVRLQVPPCGSRNRDGLRTADKAAKRSYLLQRTAFSLAPACDVERGPGRRVPSVQFMNHGSHLGCRELVGLPQPGGKHAAEMRELCESVDIHVCDRRDGRSEARKGQHVPFDPSQLRLLGCVPVEDILAQILIPRVEPAQRPANSRHPGWTHKEIRACPLHLFEPDVGVRDQLDSARPELASDPLQADGSQHLVLLLPHEVKT